jgi:dTDP-glucose 4,6-dehydratase
MLVLNYYKTFGIFVTISRCSNNYGKFQHYEKFIPKIIRHIANGENIPVHGDGQNIRDWIYVLDHCDGIEKVLKDGKPGEVYNIGCHNEKTNIEIAELVLKLFGDSKSKIEFVENRKTNDRRYSMNFDKISAELGYAPKSNFEEKLKETIEWYKEKLEV